MIHFTRINKFYFYHKTHNIRHITGLMFFMAMVTCLTTTCFGQTIDLQQKQADSLYEEGQHIKAAKLYTGLYYNSTNLNDQNARNAFRAAKAYYTIGEQDSAKLWYNRSAEDFRKLKEWDSYYIALGQIASIIDDEGEYKIAIEIAEKAEAYFKKQKDSVYAANAIHNLALYHYHNGNIQQAIQFYTEAILWAGQTSDQLKAKCYNQLGNIWADDLKDEERALEYYQKSLQLKIQSSATAKSIAFSYNNMGISHKNLGRLDSAMYYYQKAVDYAIKSKEDVVQLNPLINIANLYKRQADFESAIQTYKQALEVASSASIKQQVNLHTNIAMNYNELNNFPLALHHLAIAERLTNTTQILIDQRDVHQQKAVAYKGLKDFEKAYQEQEVVISLNDSLHKREREQGMADLMLKYESAQKDKALLQQQQIIQKRELDLRKRTIGFVSSTGLLLFIAGILFFLFKRKQAVAKQAALELKLANEKERTRIQEERLRISRELHDNIGSYLTLINAFVEQLPDMTYKQRTENFPNLQKALSLSMRELRKTVWLLNNQEISIDAITLRLRDFFKPIHQNGTKVIVQSIGNAEFILTDIQATHLFRVIQEAVSNAYKYAKAKNIYIHLEVADNICFSITDDGVGFEISSIQKGNGLQNMQTRMEELKGKINIKSKVGKGTTVEGRF